MDNISIFTCRVEKRDKGGPEKTINVKISVDCSFQRALSDLGSAEENSSIVKPNVVSLASDVQR